MWKDHFLSNYIWKNGCLPFVHTKNENITINGKLSDFENKYNDHLLRIHTSFLINPSYVTKIERFNLQLQDGTILPIPEKKYTEVKEAIFSRK